MQFNIIGFNSPRVQRTRCYNVWKHDFIVKEVTLITRDVNITSRFYAKLLNVEPRVKDGMALFNLQGSRLILKEDSTASNPPPGSSGLYHVAFVVSSIEGLSEVLRRILEDKLPLVGISDHGCTIALYTFDPDYNGVEVYWDKIYPCRLITRTLNVDWLLDLGKDRGFNSSIGHVHVKVRSLREAESFYVEALKMKVTERGYPGALFFAYGDYHHHIGANIWETRWGVKGSPWRRGYTGLERIVISPPPGVDVKEGLYVDPAGHEILVRRIGGPGGI